MPEKLTISEKNFVEKFLEKYGTVEDDSSFKYYFISVLITLLGLFILICSVILTVNNMVDRVVHWVLLPGVIFGLILMLAGQYMLTVSSLMLQNLENLSFTLLKRTELKELYPRRKRI